jgi:hypothetical protein
LHRTQVGFARGGITQQSRACYKSVTGNHAGTEIAEMTATIARHFNPEGKGYATRENAMKKLLAEVPTDIANPPVTFIITNDKGRFFPAAAGQQALALGLHFRGICVVG